MVCVAFVCARPRKCAALFRGLQPCVEVPPHAWRRVDCVPPPPRAVSTLGRHAGGTRPRCVVKLAHRSVLLCGRVSPRGPGRTGCILCTAPPACAAAKRPTWLQCREGVLQCREEGVALLEDAHRASKRTPDPQPCDVEPVTNVIADTHTHTHPHGSCGLTHSLSVARALPPARRHSARRVPIATHSRARCFAVLGTCRKSNRAPAQTRHGVPPPLSPLNPPSRSEA